jgi:hypothetical protein
MQTPLGPLKMPVVAQGMYRAPIGKAGELSAQGFYVPEQGQMSRPAYGANLMYQQRFANGGEVTGDDLFQQMITGRVVEPVYEAPPVERKPQSEVPSMDRLTGGVMRDEPQVRPQRTVLQEIIGGLEAGATIGTGIPAMVPAAARGVAGFLTPGEKLADTGKAMMDVAQSLTYMPKGEAGQEKLENLAQFLQDTEGAGTVEGYNEWREEMGQEETPSVGTIMNYVSRSWILVRAKTLLMLRAGWDVSLG